MSSTEDEHGQTEKQPSTSKKHTPQDLMVRNIVATIIENQASTITSMAKEAVQAVMSQTDGKLVDELELRMKRNEKIAPPVFKHEGCSGQYNRRKYSWENLDDTEQAVKTEDVKKALKLVDEDKTLVQKRMKLIKITDREDWGIVKEYVSDNLASDTDDEKALAKAIKAAAAKREKGKMFGTNTSRHRRTRTRPNFQRPPSHRNYDAKQRGICWSCGKLGHFQWQCFMHQ